MRERGHCEESNPHSQDISEDITKVEHSGREDTNTVDILGTSMVDAAGHKVGEVHHRFYIVSPVQGKHDGGEHGHWPG